MDGDGEYRPIYKVASYSLDVLPTVEAMVAECEKEEEAKNEE